MADPMAGWGEAIAAAIGATSGVLAGLLKIRGVRPDIVHLGTRVSVVEKGMEGITSRLERMEDKIDRLVERER